MKLAGIFLLAVLFVTGCGEDSDDSNPNAGSGGSGGSAGSADTGGAAGSVGGSGGVSGGGAGGSSGVSGGQGGSSGTSGAGGMSGAGGTGGAGTGGGGSGGDSGAGALGGTSGSGGEGVLYENDCTLEVPWECKVCDAQETCAAATYVNNGDGTITSSCCGLVWQAEIEWVIDPEDRFDGCIDRPGAAGCYTFDEAQAHCAALELAGSGWRVPTAVELQTLMVRDNGTPYIDRVAFPDAPTWDMYWTSSPSNRSDNEAWLGGFGGTFAGRRQKSQEHYVRCVR